MSAAARPVVRTLFPSGAVGRGPSYCCASISRGLDTLLAGHETWFLRATAKPSCRFALPMRPPVLNEIAFRTDRKRLRTRLEARFLSEMRELAAAGSGTPIACLWPGVSPGLIAGLRAAGIVVVWQTINTQLAHAKAILDAEHAAIGMPNLAEIPAADVSREIELARAVDYVSAPTAEVAASFRAIGVPEERILLAPFGWDPARFPASVAERPERESFTALFVGYICVRKGIHLLLRAWADSGIKGRLVLCGRIEPTIERRFGDLLARPDVTVRAFTHKVDAVYREADAFVFPTLEEGAPLVTYEAAGTGLPVVTTRMGSCDLIRDRDSGYILDAHDAGGWIEALRRLAASRDLRLRLGGAARRDALAATWTEAAARRHAQFEEIARMQGG